MPQTTNPTMVHRSRLTRGLIALVCLSLPLGFLAKEQKPEGEWTSFALSASAPQQQSEKEWTWKDAHGKVRTRADLDRILTEHKRWLDTKGESGRLADFTSYDPGGNVVGAHLAGADLKWTDLNRARLTSVNLSGANLFDANLSEAVLARSDLTGTNLATTNMTGADLTGADLTGTQLGFANLAGVHFEPKSLPTPNAIALAQGLELMTYDLNPGPLNQIRKQFQDAGFREQERAITCALNRHGAEPAQLRFFIKGVVTRVLGMRLKPGKGDWKRNPMSPGTFIEAAFKWVAFDLTCQYGLSYGRPLRIVCWLWLAFSVVYAIFMHRHGPSGIYLIGSRVWRGKFNTQGIPIRPRAIRATKWWKFSYLWLSREWRVLRAAMFFSLMSAFNIGFRDINFGRWLRLLTKREYDLKAVGWARTVSGFQSLLSVYLIALWVLTYFGRPFG
jgi:hypothetical protein